jgi:hypothetical protein
MSDAGNVAKSIRERLGANTEDRLGKALSELLENPLLTGAIGRAFDAREKASQAQEVAMGALNLPSAADIERLTRRLRAVSHRLEGIEDGVDRLDRALAPSGVEARLIAIETRLAVLTDKLDEAIRRPAPAAERATAATSPRGAATAPAAERATAATSPRGAATSSQGRSGTAAKASRRPGAASGGGGGGGGGGGRSSAKQVRAKQVRAAKEAKATRVGPAAKATKAAKAAKTPAARSRAGRAAPGKA